jgi:hypothetical protein
MQHVAPCIGDGATSKRDNKHVIYQSDDDNPTFYNAFKQVHQPTLFNVTFFSKRNLDNLQTALRRNVYELSSGKYLIDRQLDSEMLNVMRNAYMINVANQFGDTTRYTWHDTDKVRVNVKKLNDLVLEEIVPRVLNAVKFWYYYAQDKFEDRNLFDRPKYMSTQGTKTQPFINRF